MIIFLLYLQKKRVYPFRESLLLYVKSFLLQGLYSALLELQHILPLSHSLLYFSSTSESVLTIRRRIVVGRRSCFFSIIAFAGTLLRWLGYGAVHSAGLILRPWKTTKFKIKLTPV